MRYSSPIWLMILQSLSLQGEVTTENCQEKIADILLQSLMSTEIPWKCEKQDDSYSTFLTIESGGVEIPINNKLEEACIDMFENGNETAFCSTIHVEIEKYFNTLLKLEKLSHIPSSMPSEPPSAVPSFSPSRSPSDHPSFLPSGFPSVGPSSEPSRVPSNIPTSEPSRLPSVSPSRLPSDIPSHMPSMQPFRFLGSHHFSSHNVSSNYGMDDDFIVASLSSSSQSSASPTTYVLISASVASLLFLFFCRIRRRKSQRGRLVESVEALNEFDGDLINAV